MEQNKKFIENLLRFAFLSSVAMLFVVLEQSVRSHVELKQDISNLQLAFAPLALILALLSLSIDKIIAKASGNKKLAAPLSISLILRLAFAEAISVVGFTLGFMAKDAPVAYPYMGTAILLMLLTLLPRTANEQ